MPGAVQGEALEGLHELHTVGAENEGVRERVVIPAGVLGLGGVVVETIAQSVTIGIWSSLSLTRFGKDFMSRTDPMTFGDDDRFKAVSVGAHISMIVPSSILL